MKISQSILCSILVTMLSSICTFGQTWFEDRAVALGVQCVEYTNEAISWGDFNNDGWDDIFVTTITEDGLHNSCFLFQNDYNGTAQFLNVTQNAGVDNAATIKLLYLK